jgi:uncharacterized protein YjiK
MQTVQVLWESKVGALLPEAVSHRLEASGVLFHEDHFVLIFDNMDHVARIAASLTPGQASHLVLEKTPPSGHEDIAYNPQDDRFYVLIEAIPVDSGGFCSAVAEYDRDFVLQTHYPLPFGFAGDNKGFEGLAYVRHDDQDYLLALCEGNRCRGGAAGRKHGKGRIQRFRRDSEGWTHQGSIKLPPTARFTDYSSLAIRDDRVAVLSQESAQIWLGTLDLTTWRFVDNGSVWELPRDERGRTRYCNAEGVAWIAPDLLVIVSDKRKSVDSRRCVHKDQSIHIVRLE